MAMKKAKGKMGGGGSVSAPEPTVTPGQAKIAQRPIKNAGTGKVIKTGGKGATAPKPTASTGQAKIAQRPIKNSAGKVVKK
jgi:hypothetical protein